MSILRLLLVHQELLHEHRMSQLLLLMLLLLLLGTHLLLLWQCWLLSLTACHLLLYQRHDVMLHLIFLRRWFLTMTHLWGSVGLRHPNARRLWTRMGPNLWHGVEMLHDPRALLGLLEMLVHLGQLLQLWHLLKQLLFRMLLQLLLLLMLHPVLL